MKSNSLPLAQTRTGSIQQILGKLQAYWLLLKELQTGLLLVTAVTGYLTACCTDLNGSSLVSLLGTLFLTIGGSTVLNMAFDQDIDAKMTRTANRPIPIGRVTPREAWILGSLMIVSGLFWAVVMNPLYAAIVASGVILDVVVYTIWLKRLTPYAIILGGLSGGMPALAGRALALGHLDSLGFLLMLGILLWIPTHIMTFSIKYQADYALAGVPTFQSRYGVSITRWLIAGSTLLAVTAMATFGWLLHLPFPSLLMLFGLGLSLMILVLLSLVKPSNKLNFALYKGASIYMLFSMLLIIASGI
jgi:heme o synthase